MISPAIYNFRRAELERWIDEAIALLDLMDGDCDLEPSLDGDAHVFGDRIEYDLELDMSDKEWSGDEHEPNLGWGNPRCGTPDFAEGWTPSDVSDEKLHIGEPDLVPDRDAADIARRLLRDVVKDHRKIAKAISNTRMAIGGGVKMMAGLIKAPRALADIEAHDCRWPVNDAPTGKQFLFCGEASRPGKPYCTRHCRMAYKPISEQGRKIKVGDVA